MINSLDLVKADHFVDLQEYMDPNKKQTTYSIKIQIHILNNTSLKNFKKKKRKAITFVVVQISKEMTGEELKR